MPSLTIGMATYDDFDGVYFSIMSLRLHHPKIERFTTEIIVVDNNPDGAHGREIKNFLNHVPYAVYVPYTAKKSTSVRDHIFQIARGDFVMSMDCHVMFPPGVIERLYNYIARVPDSWDLLQGPLLYDDLRTVSTHFDPVWRSEMYGTWATDPRGTDINGEPFDIPMQGLGVFACRKAAWLGFNPAFKGFGGEEGYIHEKFRQRGHRALCLPFFRWTHRFQRPGNVPYPLIMEDKIRNYFIGWNELGWNDQPITDHFVNDIKHPKEQVASLRQQALAALAAQKPAATVNISSSQSEGITEADVLSAAQAIARSLLKLQKSQHADYLNKIRARSRVLYAVVVDLLKERV